MTLPWWVYFIIIVTVLFLSAFFSGAETGFIVVNKLKLRHYAENGNRKAKLAFKYTKDPAFFLATTLVGNNLANVIFSSFVSLFFLGLFPKESQNLATFSATLIGALVLLVFGEIVPKSFFRRNADWATVLISPFLKFFEILFYPLVLLLDLLARLFLKIMGIRQSQRHYLFDKAEFDYLIQESEHSGDMDVEKRELINEVIALRESQARDIMTSRTEIVGAADDSDIEEIIAISHESGFTRIPLFHENADNIVGMVTIYDLLGKETSREAISHFQREVLYVPESMDCFKLLKEFKHSHCPLAVVVDEHGGTAGIVSMEDVLEELFGEIEDEYDTEEIDVQQIDNLTFLVDGETELDMLEEEYQINLPGDGDYTTVAGFILENIGRIPRVSEKMMFENYEIIIKQATKKKIEKVLIRLIYREEA